MVGHVIFVIAAGLIFTFVGGCGCGDLAGYRSITITEIRGVDSGAWGPIEVDTSQLGPGIERDSTERADRCGNPITKLEVFPNRPIKIMLVPASHPSASK